MWTGVFWGKTFWTGVFWHPVDGATPIPKQGQGIFFLKTTGTLMNN